MARWTKCLQIEDFTLFLGVAKTLINNRSDMKIYTKSVFLLAVLVFCSTQLATAQIEITNWTQLNNVRTNLSGSYILANDLTPDTDGYGTYSSGEGWEPIGTSATPFTGTFDGNGYVISGITMTRSTALLGLFGVTSGATVKNVSVLNATINASTGGDLGILAGNAVNTTLEDVHVSGNLTQVGNTEAQRIGGITGRMTSGTMKRSSSAATINVEGRFVGGLAGQTTGSPVVQIDESFNSGNVTTTTRWVGGLVGQFGGSAVIRNSYNTGNVTGETQVGGAIGYKWRGSSLINSYSTGAITGGTPEEGVNKEVGALVGYRGPEVTGVVSVIEMSFYNAETAGVAVGVGISEGYTNAGVNARTTAQMKTEATYMGWDFSAIWQLEAELNSGYPTLHYQEVPTSIDAGTTLPSEITLRQNYPNPFNPSTLISFDLAQSGHVKLEVYSVTGSLISTLVNETRATGVHEVRFDASNLSSGVYIYRLTSGNMIQTRRMTLIK